MSDINDMIIADNFRGLEKKWGPSEPGEIGYQPPQLYRALVEPDGIGTDPGRAACLPSLPEWKADYEAVSATAASEGDIALMFPKWRRDET